MPKSRLLQDFSGSSPSQWREAAEALLKGASFEKKLLTGTYEGITLQPIYTKENTASFKHLDQFPGLVDGMRGGRASGYHGRTWEISQELPYSTAQELNQVLRADLVNGQGVIHILTDLPTQFALDPDQGAVNTVGACGVSLSNIQDFDTLLKGVDVTKYPLYLRGGPGGLPLAIVFFAWAKKYEVHPSKMRGALESDPYAFWVTQGKLPLSLENLFKEISILTKYVISQKMDFHTVTVSTTPYHDAGAHAVQELAYAMATGVDYLRRLTEEGLTIDEAARSMRFTFALSSHFFMELSKLRAARLLWAKVLEACGAREESRTMWIHARTALRDKTVIDYYNNVLRGTTEAFSAVLGQCDSMHVSPYDEAFEVPDEFSRRLARNTQLILKHECQLTDVLDPAGGSWFVESLTETLAQKGWELFQQIEALGGMEKMLTSGELQKQIAGVRSARQENVGSRKETIVGVNNYTNPKEKMPVPVLPDYAQIRKKRVAEINRYRQSAEPIEDCKILKHLSEINGAQPEKIISTGINAVLTGASLGELSSVIRAKPGSGVEIEKVPILRLSSLYEHLRQRCVLLAEKTGHAPSVLQLNIGPSREYRARADWTTNFLMAGGLLVHADRDFPTDQEAIKACETSQSSIIILCSTDERYAQTVTTLVPAILAKAPSKIILLAGAPGEQEKPWREAGVTDFIHVRVPNYQCLDELVTKLEAAGR